MIFILQVSPRSTFQIETETNFSLALYFLDKTTLASQFLVRPLSDSDVASACSTMSHLLGLDLLSLSTGQKDAFCAALVVLA